MATRTKEQTEPRATFAGVRARRLNADDEMALHERWRVGKDSVALSALVEAHGWLVSTLAWQYRNSGVAMEDLIQEGTLGLTVAVRRFDPGRGAKLSTYSSYWIRAYMLQHLLAMRGPVRLGTTSSQRRIFFGHGRARHALEGTGQTADPDALAAMLHVTRCELDAMLPRLSRQDRSLDAPRLREDGHPMPAELQDPASSPEELLAASEEAQVRKELISRGMKHLDAREAAIIEGRYFGVATISLSQLGVRLGITRERVRQLEARALGTLRSQCRVPRSPQSPRPLH